MKLESQRYYPEEHGQFPFELAMLLYPPNVTLKMAVEPENPRGKHKAAFVSSEPLTDKLRVLFGSL